MRDGKQTGLSTCKRIPGASVPKLARSLQDAVEFLLLEMVKHL